MADNICAVCTGSPLYVTWSSLIVLAGVVVDSLIEFIAEVRSAAEKAVRLAVITLVVELKKE